MDIRVDKRLINPLRLLVSLLLLPHLQEHNRELLHYQANKQTNLLFKPQSLLKRIIQLRVRIAKLLPTHESFKAFAQSRT